MRICRRLLVGIVTVVTCVTIAQAADDLPPLPVGYDAYRMWGRWPQQRIGQRAYMRSTYDRTGGNEGADASHFLRQGADDFNVTLDVAGPGVLYFSRFNHWHGSPWHFVVDGKDNVITETSTADPNHPAKDAVLEPHAAFPTPLAYTWADTRGADLIWAPIGFEQSFQMAYGRTHYGTGYYIFDQFLPGAKLSRPIRAWDQTPPDKDVISLLGKSAYEKTKEDVNQKELHGWEGLFQLHVAQDHDQAGLGRRWRRSPHTSVSHAESIGAWRCPIFG